jgi:hypothetical protein
LRTIISRTVPSHPASLLHSIGLWHADVWFSYTPHVIARAPLAIRGEQVTTFSCANLGYNPRLSSWSRYKNICLLHEKPASLPSSARKKKKAEILRPTTIHWGVDDYSTHFKKRLWRQRGELVYHDVLSHVIYQRSWFISLVIRNGVILKRLEKRLVETQRKFRHKLVCFSCCVQWVMHQEQVDRGHWFTKIWKSLSTPSIKNIRSSSAEKECDMEMQVQHNKTWNM